MGAPIPKPFGNSGSFRKSFFKIGETCQIRRFKTYKSNRWFNYYDYYSVTYPCVHIDECVWYSGRGFKRGEHLVGNMHCFIPVHRISGERIQGENGANEPDCGLKYGQLDFLKTEKKETLVHHFHF
jgi:hypothetical protein